MRDYAKAPFSIRLRRALGLLKPCAPANRHGVLCRRALPAQAKDRDAVDRVWAEVRQHALFVQNHITAGGEPAKEHA